MEADIGGAIIGISAFLSMFVIAYFCRRQPSEPVPIPEPPPVVHEDPGDPQMLR
jgi:hypothetical protein